MKKLVFIAPLCVSILSCVSTYTTVLNPSQRHPPLTPDKVVIYTSADKVPGKYEEVAVLSSQGAYTVAGDDKFYESFRKEAAKIGANGVILSAIEDPTTGQKVGSAVLGALLIPNAMANRKTQAMAIYVTTPADEAAEAREAAMRAEQTSRMETLPSFVHAGMTRKELFMAVGPPTASDADLTRAGDVREVATYVSTGGKTFVVNLLKNVVVDVVQK